MNVMPHTMLSRINTLKKQFAEHRAQVKSGTRVPDALRAATLELIDLGVSEKMVGKACHISSTQIRRWRDNSAPGVHHHKAPRVLQVIDDIMPAPEPAARVTIEGRRIIIDLLL